MKLQMYLPTKQTIPILLLGIVISGCGTVSGKPISESDMGARSDEMLREKNEQISSLEHSLARERQLRRDQVAASRTSPSGGAAETELLPPKAKPGECYARVFIPPEYRAEAVKVLKKEASERFEVIPAKYESAQETVTIKEPSERLELVPATYEMVQERVLVKPASKRIVEVPAAYKTVTEKVLDKPEHTVWKKGTGPITKIDQTTGEIMCLVTVPATYKTVTKRVLESPATTREIEVPAEYKTISKRVMKTPPTTRTVKIPGEYRTVQVTKKVAAAKTERIPIAAEYATVTKRVLVSEGEMAWKPVLCDTNLNARVTRDLQLSLKQAGFDPGPIDGVIGEQTLSATTDYQRAKGLPTGGLTMETLRALDVQLAGGK